MNGESCCDVINDTEKECETEISIVTSKDIYKLIASSKGFLRELPVIGYNFGRYGYNSGRTKGFFPYEWVTSLSKLDCESLPPKEAVHSDLKTEVMSDRNYAYCEQIWRNYNMKTFRVFLVITKST